MTLRTPLSGLECPMARALDVLGDPWALMILREVFTGNRRFDGLKDELAIADTVLSKRLRALVEAGLLRRVPYGGSVRPRVEYALTDAGSGTLPVLNALSQWGTRHTESPTGGWNLRIECLKCGQVSESADWCRTCAAPLDRGNTGWRRAGDPQRLISLAAR